MCKTIPIILYPFLYRKEKTVAQQKKTGEQLTVERVTLEKAQMQVKRDCESMFQREAKLWDGKKVKDF